MLYILCCTFYILQAPRSAVVFPGGTGRNGQEGGALKSDVVRFLNRLLGLPPRQQEMLFNYYSLVRAGSEYSHVFSFYDLSVHNAKGSGRVKNEGRKEKGKRGARDDVWGAVTEVHGASLASLSISMTPASPST
jgi:hypothetical protein